MSRWFHSNPLSLQGHDIFLCNTYCRYSMLNGILDSQKVRAHKAAVSSQSTGGVASSLATRKTDKRSKYLRMLLGSGTKQCCSERTSTCWPLLSNIAML
jgi:hypothetical protein